MKNIIKLTVIAIAILVSSVSTSAQTGTLEKLLKIDGVTSVYISKAMLSIIGANNLNLDDNISAIANDLNSIEIYNIENKKAIEQSRPIIAKLSSTPGLEILTRINEDKESTIIYGKQTNKVFSQILIVVDETDEISIINLTGNIPLDKISELTK